MRSRALNRAGSRFFALSVCLALFLFLRVGTSVAQSGKPEGKQPKEDREASVVARTARTLLKHHETQLFGRPFTINALPLAFFTRRTGLNFGFRALLTSRQSRPYLYRLTLQVLASVRGSHRHRLVFDYPRIARSRFGAVFRAEWVRDLEARYFGLGNDSQNVEAFTRPESRFYIEKDFYLYNLKRPRLELFATREIVSELRFWVGFGVEKVQPQLKKGTATSFLAQDHPLGYLGGSGRFLSFRLTWDTRSDVVFPSAGFISEVSVEPNFASVREETTGATEPSSRSHHMRFTRYTFSDAHFLPIFADRLIFANRLAFEAIAGDAPYYAFGDFAGERRTHAVGGSQSLRGYQSRRFQDKIKLITLTELRFKYRHFRFMSQTFDLIFVAFFDNGRVWHRWADLSFDGFHTTVGLGVWLNWNNGMILRLDMGHSPEETLIAFLRLSTAF